MHRFFVNPEQIVGDTVHFRADQTHQIGRVLRMHAGDVLLVLDSSGLTYDVLLQHIEPESALGRITHRAQSIGEPRTHLTLYQSLLKRDKFEWVLQKGTEIGVSRFVPVITRRTLVREAGTVTPEKHERWQRIITEAAEQSGRGRLPQLAEPLPFELALGDAVSTTRRALIAWEDTPSGDLTAALAQLPTGSSVAVFVGPEGGFEADEVALAQEHGLWPVTLGPRILRTETAAMIAPALILFTLGDMSR